MAGRPRLEHPASEQIRIRVTPGDKEHITALAKAAGVSISRYLVDRALAGHHFCA